MNEEASQHVREQERSAAQICTFRSESQIPALSAINDVADLKSDEPSKVRHEAGARNTTQEEDKERMGCVLFHLLTQ